MPKNNPLKLALLQFELKLINYFNMIDSFLTDMQIDDECSGESGYQNSYQNCLNYRKKHKSDQQFRGKIKDCEEI